LGIYTRRAVDRTIHAGGATKKSLSHSLSYRKFSLNYLFHENHFSASICDGPFSQVKDGTNCPAKATAGTLGDSLALFFIELQLISHRLS